MTKLASKTPSRPKESTTPLDALNFIAKMIFALFTGGSVIGNPETLSVVGDGNPYKLQAIPEGAIYCIVVCEAGALSTMPTKCIRFSQGETNVLSMTQGMPLGELGVVEISGVDAMENVCFMSSEIGVTSVLTIEYYG